MGAPRKHCNATLRLKDLPQVQITSRQLLDELNGDANLFDPPYWFLRERVRYLAGQSTPEEFVGSIEDSRRGQCVANYLIALTYRAENEQDTAREYFHACVRTKQFWIWQYHFSKTILKLEFGEELAPEISL